MLVGGLWYGVCGGLLFWCLFWFDVGLWLVVCVWFVVLFAVCCCMLE